ncbi:MAG TPA: hypothetical protein VH370_24615 [Humisphaera sp.]|nr:hypothetical protein [Humisphaera sp.]
MAQEAAPATAPSADRPAAKPKSFDWKELMDPYIDLFDQKDPLGRISRQMVSSGDRLAQLKTNKPTQVVQADIIAGLDDFIAMLEKRKKNAKSGSNPNPTDPLPDSVLAKGPGGQGNMHDPNASSRLWGQLPAKQREQILQSQTEGFPSGYESILSSYYKRLAQENVGDAGTASTPAPATQPAPAR